MPSSAARCTGLSRASRAARRTRGVSRRARTKIGYGKIVFRYFDARIVDRDHDGRERLRADLVRVRRGTAIWIARDRGVEYDGLVDHHGELHRGKLTGAHLELARRE